MSSSAYQLKQLILTEPILTETDLSLLSRKILSLPSGTVDPVVVNKKFKKLALKYHPDKRKTTDAGPLFRVIVAAKDKWINNAHAEFKGAVEDFRANYSPETRNAVEETRKRREDGQKEAEETRKRREDGQKAAEETRKRREAAEETRKRREDAQKAAEETRKAAEESEQKGKKSRERKERERNVLRERQRAEEEAAARRLASEENRIKKKKESIEREKQRQANGRAQLGIDDNTLRNYYAMKSPNSFKKRTRKIYKNSKLRKTYDLCKFQCNAPYTFDDILYAFAIEPVILQNKNLVNKEQLYHYYSIKALLSSECFNQNGINEDIIRETL